MTDAATEQSVRVRAYSPGRYPILVVELEDGGLRTAYFETGYDLGRTKAVGEDWLKDNAISRHSFVEVRPPREMRPDSLRDYVNGELLQEP